MWGVQSLSGTTPKIIIIQIKLSLFGSQSRLGTYMSLLILDKDWLNYVIIWKLNRKQ